MLVTIIPCTDRQGHPVIYVHIKILYVDSHLKPTLNAHLPKLSEGSLFTIEFQVLAQCLASTENLQVLI